MLKWMPTESEALARLPHVQVRETAELAVGAPYLLGWAFPVVKSTSSVSVLLAPLDCPPELHRKFKKDPSATGYASGAVLDAAGVERSEIRAYAVYSSSIEGVCDGVAAH